ncbi:MAG: FeoB-associated Cys-rich membrane protein [Clostridiales bacterium]
MTNIIVCIVILAIIILALAKIYFEKKKGAKCVGCPYSQSSDGSRCRYNKRM